jgi:hypothetical protein
MQNYKLVIDGHRSWTSCFISASCDLEACEKAAEMAGSLGDALSLKLMRGNTQVWRVAKAAIGAAIEKHASGVRETARIHSA